MNLNKRPKKLLLMTAQIHIHMHIHNPQFICNASKYERTIKWMNEWNERDRKKNRRSTHDLLNLLLCVYHSEAEVNSRGPNLKAWTLWCSMFNLHTLWLLNLFLGNSGTNDIELNDQRHMIRFNNKNRKQRKREQIILNDVRKIKFSIQYPSFQCTCWLFFLNNNEYVW